MSAVAGSWRLDHQASHADDCIRILAAQNVYGPHKTEQEQLGVVTLGRNLFAVSPDDMRHIQPVTGAGGRYHLVADANLGNRRELARNLAVDQACVAALGDAGVILRAFERWHLDCCDHLVGDYAFAVWDAQDRKLYLVRDAMGSRPLHFHVSDRLVAFASMPKGLAALPEIGRAPDLEIFVDGMTNYAHSGDRSCYQRIRRVKPGHYAIIDANGARQQRHWNPKFEPVKLRNQREYAELLRSTFDEAVARQLQGLDNVATHLSAGLDSSAVTTSAALHLRGRGRVTAYTSVPRPGYEDDVPRRIVDEGEYAAAAAELYDNIDHVKIHGTAQSLFSSINEAVDYFDQPITNPCNQIWGTAINCRAKEDGHTVLLTGQMGNFSFSYDGLHLFSELIGRAQFLKLGRELMASRRSGWASAKGQLGAAILNSLPKWVRNGLRRTSRLNAYLPAHPSLLEGVRTSLADRFATAHAARMSSFNRIDMGGYRKGYLAQTGIDIRDPTTDKLLVELCLNIPTEQYFRDGVPRALARAMLAGRLPADMIGERRKGYQAPDWHEALERDRAEIIEQFKIFSGDESLRTMIDNERFLRLLDKLPSENWNSVENIRNYRAAMLRGVSIGNFIRRMSGANR